MNTTLKRFLKFWLAGFAVGVALCCFWYLNNSGKIVLSPDALLFIEPFTYILWLSSLMLMSLSGQHPISTIVIESISLSINGFIYMGVGYIIGEIFRTGTHSDEQAES
jgi:hypothetical protein